VKSRKSEVLFVDYIVEHLNKGGRAGVIVPDGIVANPQAMFVKLRKLLIENGLFAVVSLHNSVFLPYAVAKTSILFLDRATANRTRQVLFATIENDGFDLGQQRRLIHANDLPTVLSACRSFQDQIANGNAKMPGIRCATVVNRADLAAGYDLFPNRYVAAKGRSQDGYLPIGTLFNIEKGSLQSSKNQPGAYPFITAAEGWSTHNKFTHECEALVFAMAASGSLGRTHYVKGRFIASDLCFILTPKDDYKDNLNLRFYHAYFNAIRGHVVRSMAKGGAKLSINKTDFAAFPILFLPKAKQDSLGVQILKEATAIEGFKKQIDASEKQIAALVSALVANEAECQD
jgi:type I restriction-modification system DNA methylase subunit